MQRIYFEITQKLNLAVCKLNWTVGPFYMLIGEVKESALMFNADNDKCSSRNELNSITVSIMIRNAKCDRIRCELVMPERGKPGTVEGSFMDLCLRNWRGGSQF